MNDKVLQAIAEALPETQVAMIRDSLNELTALREEKIQLVADVKQYREYWNDQTKKASALDAQLTVAQSKLTAATDELEEARKKLSASEVTEMRAELNGVNNTVDKFLKNTIYRETLQHQVVDEYPNVTPVYNNGMSSTVVNGTNKINKEVTDVKTKESE